MNIKAKENLSGSSWKSRSSWIDSGSIKCSRREIIPERIERSCMLLTLIFWVGFLLPGCRSTESEAPASHMVTFQGDSTLTVFSFTDGMTIKPSVDNRAAHYMRDNTLLSINDFTYLYRSTDGLKLEVEVTDFLLVVNGKPRSIIVDTFNQSGAMEWIRQASEEAIGSLLCIQINIKPDETQLTSLSGMLRQNPNVLIRGEYGSPAIQQLISLTKPLFIVPDGETFPVEMFNGTNVSMAFISPEQADRLTPQQFPALKRLICTGHNVNEILEKFPNMEAVSVYPPDESLQHLSFSKNNQLKEVHLVGNEDLQEVSGLGSLNNLECLSIYGSEIVNITGVDGLTGLNALTLSGADILLCKTLIKNNPDLTYLLIADYDITDLNIAGEVAQLETIVLGKNAGTMNLESLQSLYNLRYIGLDADVFNGATNQEVLRKVKQSCPECVIYQVQGFCLGAGWVLLFLPLLMLFFYRKRRAAKPVIH